MYVMCALFVIVGIGVWIEWLDENVEIIISSYRVQIMRYHWEKDVYVK